MPSNSSLADPVCDLPTATVYRATHQATQQWMEARETLIATRGRAEAALLTRWGIDPGAYVERHPEGWAIYTDERPPGCESVRVNDDPAWTPDHSTEEGQRLAAQMDALPTAISAGDAENALGLPGRMPLAHTRPDGTRTRRQGLLLDGRMYLAWEHPIDDVDLEASVWERVDPIWWRAQRHEMTLDQMVARIKKAVSTHVYHRHLDPFLDQLLTLVWEVAQHSRDHDLLTQVQEAMNRAQEPIHELDIRDRIARGFIRCRIALGTDTDPHGDLEQILTQVRTLHSEHLTSA